ncbi:4308_t:CDS:2 [Funneliformis geosporum]|uniref:2798_t:CDS:1 n=1 Tax=Funneliformis geosporum TaxID=1117311 RepID=A0A9W4SK37_9GLOM|nr:4308_t:CDS:2 [Funneliformis geosporum]CAI2172843.1 2798_t:CDS:2 [Funneliformis geosporum]
MSTRSQRTADKSLTQKHAKILKSCLEQPENKYCADYPRWASWNLGIFVCITCSGTHRSMGTHISRVKSVDLDTWTPEQVEKMVLWGNAKANIYWEANLTNKRPPESNMDSWIRRKYELKNWVMSREIPDPKNLGEPDLGESKRGDTSDNKTADLLSSTSSTSNLIKKSPAISQLQGADLFSIGLPTKNTSSVPSSPTQKKETLPMPRSTTPNSLGSSTSNNYEPTSHENLKSSILSLYNIQQNLMPQGSQYFATTQTLSGNSIEKKTPSKADDAFSGLLDDFTKFK